MSRYDYEDIAHLSHAEVMAKIDAIKCVCVSRDDAYACARFRNPRNHDLEIELLGQASACECDCHDIWDAWVSEDYE